jgi:hypothetical protein
MAKTPLQRAGCVFILYSLVFLLIYGFLFSELDDTFPCTISALEGTDTAA